MVAQESPDDDRARLHGTVPSAGRLLKAFDVLVLSARTEGTPMILFEAMGAEVPVLDTYEDLYGTVIAQSRGLD